MERKQLLSVLLFALAFAAEIFFFNFPYWQSLTFSSPADFTVETGRGLEAVDGQCYRVADAGESWIELSGFRAEVKNLYIDLFDDTEAHHDRDVIPLRIRATDAGHKRGVTLTETEIVYGVPESRYLRLHLVGETDRVWIEVGDCPFLIRTDRIRINTVRPFSFHLPRLLLLLLCGLLFLLFRPSSSLYQKQLNLRDRRQAALLLLLIFLQASFLTGTVYVFMNRNWKEGPWLADLEYNMLTDAFLDGHPWLDLPPSPTVDAMDNPYDTTERLALLQEAGETPVYDFAWYEGKYYCYFGIVPVLLFCLPYQALTGEWLYTGYVVLLCALLFIPAVYIFLYRIVRHFFSGKISIGMYLLLSSVLLFSGGPVYCTHLPTIYSLPILTGILLDLAGIILWLCAAQAEKGFLRYLTAGSLCVALVMGCRPHLAIAALFAVPLFWDRIRSFRSDPRRFGRSLLCFLLPFIIIGAGLMLYNLIRFDDPLDFGVKRMLTGFDMMHNGNYLSKLPLGLFESFLQPLNIKPRFPYMFGVGEGTQLPTDYAGAFFSEPLLGGFFAFNPVALILPGLFLLRKRREARPVYALSLVSIFCALAIAVIDICMAGMTLRYINDFALFLMIPTALLILSFPDNTGDDRWAARILKLLILLAVLGILLNTYSILADDRTGSMRTSAPRLFYTLKYLLFVIR